MKTNITRLTLFVAGVALTACSNNAPTGPDGKDAPASSGARTVIKIDGSSTVFPINEAVAEEFQRENKARVTIGVSGTGGGFKKFCRGEIEVTGASRPIKPSEVKLCGEAGIGYTELPVAYDGIAIVVHKENTWADKITVEELKALWAPEAQGKITRWSQVRTGWPDEEIHLFGPGVDSGTYDYFTKAIVGKEHSSRGDFTSSEDDNVLVKGVSSDRLALGFFGFAYYSENKDKLRAVPLDDGDEANGQGGVVPSVQTVGDGTYQPLSRPIFVYVSEKAAERAEVSAFIDFYLTQGGALAQEVGYISLPAAAYSLAKQRFVQRVPGSLFGGEGSKVGVAIEDLLRSGMKAGS
jgi:phosphate transport system substrate-binding protein